MKITQKKLKQIIKEELQSVLPEQSQDPLVNILQTIQALQVQVQGLIQTQAAAARTAQEKVKQQQKAIATTTATRPTIST